MGFGSIFNVKNFCVLFFVIYLVIFSVFYEFRVKIFFLALNPHLGVITLEKHN